MALAGDIREAWGWMGIESARALGLGAFFFIVAGCASSQQIQRLDRSTEYSISCSYFGWYICYNRANELCPDRYKVLSESERFNGRELRIACPDAK